MLTLLLAAGIALSDTWSESGKAITIKGETQLISQNCTAEEGCSLQHMWFGGAFPGFDQTRLKVFVDNEENAAIDGRFYMIHGMGYPDDNGPWSAGDVFGKTGSPSGIFNTFVIPFTKNIRITVQAYETLDQPSSKQEVFWFIFRGQQFTSSGGPYQSHKIAGVPVLPPKSAGKTAKLLLVKNENITTPTFGNVTLFSLNNQTGGLFLVTIAAGSENEAFLEGQVRGKSPSSAGQTVFSSGTEDYFLGTYYFNRGEYMNGLAGLTHMTKGSPASFSAYRLHTNDPITFSNGYSMTWRCGEPGFGANAHACYSVFTYSWVYVLV